MSDTASNSNGAVSFRNIVKRFDDVVAVDDLNLTIAPGEFFALLGPSGCGKTTTLRMVAGLEFPTSGSLTIGGNEVGTLPPNKRPVNTVFQNYALFPHLNVADNVGFGLKMKGVSKSDRASRVSDALELVQLGEYGTRKPNQLSGGQQQRVALARALVNRPEVLLLDEPLAALDLKLRQGMQEELKTIQRELGITFIFVTHDQEEALTMSDRIGVMNHGRLLQVGTPKEIYEHPTSRFVADFIGRSNFLPGTAAGDNLVTLNNGDKIRADHDLDPGTSVSVSIRPETLHCEPGDTTHVSSGDGSAGAEATTALCGTVATTTYLGEAIVYKVHFDWLELEVRQDNLPSVTAFNPGDQVTVRWLPEAAAVVPGDE